MATTNTIDAPSIVIGTITFGADDFIRETKEIKGMEISEVTVDNRNLLPDIILRKISNILNTRLNKGKQNQKQNRKMLDEGRITHSIHKFKKGEFYFIL